MPTQAAAAQPDVDLASAIRDLVATLKGQKRSSLPGWPAVLREDLAAAYVGLSATTFRKEVKPKVPPIPLTEKRQGWRRTDLDAWIAERAGDPPQPTKTSSWADA